MTLEEVMQFINDNEKDEKVQAYVKGFVTLDRVQAFLETDEGKRLMQPRLDSYFAKGLETWKTNNLQKLVDEKVLEKYPAETEQEKRIKALEQKLAQEENARKRQEIEKKALLLLSESNLPADLVDYISASDDNELNAKFQNLKSALDKWTGQQNEEKFRNAGRNPRKPASLTDGTKNPWSKETWNLTEQGRLLRDDPELAKYFKDNTRR